MSIDARIAGVRRIRGSMILYLAAYRTSDGTMSIPGVDELKVFEANKIPHAGQKIWGNSGQCIVEAGYGGERIEYTRRGINLEES